MPGELSTYFGMVDGHRLFGGMNIYVIIGRFIPANVTDWKVVDDCSSDHLAIVYEIAGGSSDGYQCNVPVQQSRFSTYMQKTP